jgi:hypothetical protein
MNFKILLLPLIITALPMLLMLVIYRLQSKISSFWLTLSAVIPVVLIGFFTPFFAISVSVNGFTQNGIRCATGAAVFLPVGGAFTFVTIILGIVICMRSFSNHR